ncbi:MAG: hypothetical protein JSV86_04100 [Gemmatimonadota bacterium]|nr:MAG: hypothetical protein JSV86_04100 [Gemmatimonadota bacterium]
MVGGSGLPTAQAGRIKSPAQVLPQILLFFATLTSASGCIYFNSYYNANQLFEQGLRDIEEGRESTGRSTLAASIEKAEGIVAANPDSRWADDAVRIIVRARLLREEWEEVVSMSHELLRYAETRRDTAEVAGYLGIAQRHLSDPAAADSLLLFALSEEEDDERRAILLHNRALAQARLGRFDGAYTDLLYVSRLRPAWVQPRIDRVGLLVNYGRGADAALELGAIWPLRLTDAEEQAVVEAVQHIAQTSPEVAFQALDGVETSSLSRENRARLVASRGDLHRARGEIEEARADYELAARVAPESRPGADARLMAAQLTLASATTVGELAATRKDLEQLMQRRVGRITDIMRLWDTLVRVEYWVDLGGLAYLLAGEAARDALGAPGLARTLFLRYADEEPESVWAPKALLAVLELTALDSATRAEESEPDWEDLRLRLWIDYPDSPYVLAILNERPSDGLTYEELELGLRRQLARLETLADEEVMARRTAISR